MFVGGRRRSSKNVRAMQLFHELKQQFPTIPDHVVAECIATTSGAEAKTALLAAAAAAAAAIATTNNTTITANATSRHRHDQQTSAKPMATAAPHRARNEEMMNRNEKPKPAKRPDSLSLRQSDKCKDVHKLLAATSSSSSSSIIPPTMTMATTTGLQKPPRPKTRNHLKPSEKTESASGGGGGGSVVRRRTAEAQTTDTLLNASPTTPPPPPSVNLSLNVNVIRGGVGGVQPAAMTSPTSKHSSVLNVVPQQPWCCPDLNSPRSYTSVNLTLRTPTSEPQPPIDITSQNSSLTYSTSSFDCQKGLQSRLQITVGPGGGTVSSVRTRPRSYHSPTSSPIAAAASAVVGQPNHHGSLQDLATTTTTTEYCTTPTILKQQARIERLRIELISEKNRLVKIKAEVAQMKLEQQEADEAIALRTETELQLLKEIRHLRTQCDLLTNEVDRQSENREITAPLGETSAEFYRNIYAGHQGAASAAALRSPASGPIRSQMSTAAMTTTSSTSETKWSCPMCTFQNHPLLDKCEQCEMARILHGKSPIPSKPATIGGGSSSSANTDFDKIQQLLAPCNNNNNNNNNNNINSGVDLMRWLSEPAPIRPTGDKPPSAAAVTHNSTSSTS